MSRGDLRMSAFPSPTITALLAPGAREVLAGLRVDPDHVALADEVGHLHHQAGPGRGGLADVRARRPPKPPGGSPALPAHLPGQAPPPPPPPLGAALRPGVAAQ